MCSMSLDITTREQCSLSSDTKLHYFFGRPLCVLRIPRCRGQCNEVLHDTLRIKAQTFQDLQAIPASFISRPEQKIVEEHMSSDILAQCRE